MIKNDSLYNGHTFDRKVNGSRDSIRRQFFISENQDKY